MTIAVKSWDSLIADNFWRQEMPAPARWDDEAICSRGLDQMRAGLERGQQSDPHQAPGHPGQTIDVKPPADWKPKFLSVDIYGPKQDKSRQTLRDSFLTFLN
jgi:hypothetical protein